MPKYLGPFRISKTLKEGATYQLDLSKELRARGLNNAFHASLLRPHLANDDRRFPGRQFHQLPGFGEQPREWAVDRFLSHIGRGAAAEFEVQWSTGDVTWVPYRDVKHLQAFTEYCEALGISNIRQLQDQTTTIPEAATSGTIDHTVKLNVNAIMVTVRVAQGHNNHGDDRMEALGDIQKGRGSEHKEPNSPARTTRSQSFSSTSFLSRMARGVNEYTAEDGVRWETYAREFAAWVANPRRDRLTYPGNPPEGYYEVYQIHQRFAPGPREYADLIDSVFAAPPQQTTNGLVTLPPDAFVAVLNSWSGTKTQLLQILTEDRAFNAQRGPRPYAPRGSYVGRGGFRGGYGGRGGGYHGGRGGGPYGGRGGYAGRGGYGGGFGGYRGGHAAPLVDRVGGHQAAPKKKPRNRKHGKGAQAAAMDACKSIDPDVKRRFAQCFAPLMRAFGVLDLGLTDNEGDGQPEAGPSGQIPDEEDFELPDEDSGPEIGEGEDAEDDGFSNTG